MKTLNYLFFAMALLVAASAASAQVTRIVLDSHSCRQSGCVDVYESDFVDVPPQFPGRERGLVNYINKTRQYPYDAYKKRIQGRVICSFVVNTDGSVCNVSVIRGANPELDKEAVRIIKAMPEWTPGILDGEAVPVRCIIPIPFRL